MMIKLTQLNSEEVEEPIYINTDYIEAIEIDGAGSLIRVPMHAQVYNEYKVLEAPVFVIELMEKK